MRPSIAQISRMIKDVIMREMGRGRARTATTIRPFEVAAYLPAFAGRPRLVGAAVEASWRGAAFLRF